MTLNQGAINVVHYNYVLSLSVKSHVFCPYGVEVLNFMISVLLLKRATHKKKTLEFLEKKLKM